MINCLEHVAKRERFTVPPNVADQIVSDCEGNVRKAILMLEALKMQS
jgi:replication factor C subunit 3/5